MILVGPLVPGMLFPSTHLLQYPARDLDVHEEVDA